VPSVYRAGSAQPSDPVAVEEQVYPAEAKSAPSPALVRVSSQNSPLSSQTSSHESPSPAIRQVTDPPHGEATGAGVLLMVLS